MTTDFDTCWQAFDDESAELPARPVLDHVPSRSTAELTACALDTRLGVPAIAKFDLVPS